MTFFQIQETDLSPDGGKPGFRKPELLAPAGNFEKLETAIHYGADAVYLAGKDFSLRNYSGNFTDDQLSRAVTLAHSRNVKVYVACNIYPRNHEHDGIRNFLETIGAAGADAVIVSDPGVVLLARKTIPHVDIHLSTQANTTHLTSAHFWRSQGVKRVNLARELSLAEVVHICGNADIETEIFIHGAMCISYSGRCLLSTFLSGRDSNRGLCSHPCRWRYALMEELRPNQFYPVTEDPRGTYVFNAKDLCMIEHVPELIQSGVTSLKIEGRMKGIHYLAAVVKTYRDAIDTFLADPEGYSMNPGWRDELSRVYHRDYCTGFYFGQPDAVVPNFEDIHQGQIHRFIGKILAVSDGGGHLVEIRNKLRRTDQVEVLSPGKPVTKSEIMALSRPDGTALEQAQPNTRAVLNLAQRFAVHDIVCKI